ncbi:hypothetical protein Trydic_g16648 [Trypoxylus dichotomus]
MDTEWTLRCICNGSVYTVDKPLFRLGRHREHDIVCSSVVISREHAHFILENKKLYIKDLGSANGTYINGERVGEEEKQILQNGDIVTFGYPSHVDPCPSHGCFVYEVSKKEKNSTAAIIKLLEESHVSIEHVQDEPQLPASTIKKEGSILENNNSASPNHMEWDNINVINNLNENHDNREPCLVENRNNVAVKIEKQEVIEEMDNGGSYSIEDNIIVIDDDIEDINQVSSSQLFPLNDPYPRIKAELAEYDYVNQRPPIIVDSDESSDFNILDILDDTRKVEDCDIVSVPNQNERKTSNDTETAKLFDVDHKLKECIDENGVNDSTAKSKNKEITTEINSGRTNNNLQFSALNNGGSKYTKPPIIDAPVLPKQSRTQPKEKNAKSNRTKPKTLKRQNSFLDKKHISKKQKTLLNNISDPQPSTSSGITDRTRRSNNITLTKEDKLKIKEERKQKLKEISKQTNIEPPKSFTSNLNNKPCVKVSKGRGGFMLDTASSSVTTRRKSVTMAQTVPKCEETKKTFESATKMRSTSLSTEPSTSSNDPRIKINSIFNNATTSNNLSTLNTSKMEISVDMKSKANDLLMNNDYVSSIRNGTLNNSRAEISVSYKPIPIYKKQLFNDILNMLNWRTLWLEEQKRSSTYPPVNKRPAVKMCNSFSNHKDYCNIVIPLLMIELWYELYEDWLSIDNVEKQMQRKFSCVIQEVEVKSTYFILKCIAYITKKQNRAKQYVKESNIVILNVPMESEGRFIYFPLFGFVINCEKRLIKGNDLIDTHLSRQLKPDIPESLLHLEIVIKVTANKICHNKCMDGAMLLSVVSLVREFDAVYNLVSSPLCKYILDPKIEDYNIKSDTSFNGIEMEKLNEVQDKAVQEATELCLGEAPGIYLIQGPPGTGKTTVIKNIVKNVILGSSKKIRLLITAPSNSAIDSVAIKIIKELKARLLDNEKKKIRLVRVGPWHAINEEIKPYSLDQFSKVELTKTFLMEHPEVRRDFDNLYVKRSALKAEIEMAKKRGIAADALREKLAAVESDYECFAKKYMKQEYQRAFENARKRIYSGSNIVCTTLSSCARLMEMDSTMIDCCIVDEATQSKEVETLIPLMLGVNKLILVGDPQQLPAVTISQQAKDLEYGQSLFQRIRKNFLDSPTNPIRMLNIQHRMHPEISLFPNNTFYNGKCAK